MRAFLIHTSVVVLILIVGFSPFISVMAAGLFAESNGCILHEGYINPCVVNGVDHGSTLYTMFVLGWLGLVTVPAGLIGEFIYFVIVGAYYLIRYLRRRTRVSTI
jgi:hypothetical protein